jgi:hypothetical protein
LDVQVPTIRGFCDTSLNRFTRLIALNSLTDHLQKITAILQELQVENQLHPESSTLIKDYLLDSSFFHNMLEYVWKNWDDSYEPIIDQTKVIFKSVLEIIDLAQGRYPEIEKFKQLKSYFMDDLVTRLLAVDWNTKVI